MSPLRVLRGLIAGGAGGVIGWLLTEFLPLGPAFRPHRYEAEQIAVQMTPGDVAWMGMVIGLSIGGLLGLSEGIAEGTSARFRRTSLWFLGLGGLGGFLGMYFGQLLYAMLGGRSDPALMGPAEFIPQVMARALSWLLVGFFLGAVFGVPGASIRRGLNGAIGGSLGGFLGGFIFQVLNFTGIFTGIVLRLIGFALIGAFIGFFVGLVAEVMKRIWVKVLIGRNEGREYEIDTDIAYIGRDELADVPVFRDPQVPRRMASLRAQDGRYALFAESNALPLLVNGEPAATGQILRDGDAIQFGAVTIGYFEKATATGGHRPIDLIALQQEGDGRQQVAIPRQEGVCSYCGMQKHPLTGECACTLPAAGAPAYDAGWGDPAAPQPYSTAAYPAGAAAGAWNQPAPQAAPGGWPDAQPAADPYGSPYAAPPAPGSGAPHLVVVTGPLAGQIISLDQELQVGRDPAMNLPLVGDPTASRRHARIYAAGAGWAIEDLGSSNGTFVNGARATGQMLNPGDLIRIGGTELRFSG